MNKTICVFFLLLFFLLNATTFAIAKSPEEKRRDPFVPLIDAKGRLRDFLELFPPRAQNLPIKVELKGILWDENNPLAVLADKIVPEGSSLGGGVTLEKVNEDHIILTYDGEKFIVNLRKEGVKK